MNKETSPDNLTSFDGSKWHVMKLLILSKTRTNNLTGKELKNRFDYKNS